MDKTILLILMLLSLTACSKKNYIPIVTEAYGIVNIPLEHVQTIAGVEDSATIVEKRKVKKLQQSVKEKEAIIQYIKNRINCFDIKYENNSIFFIPKPGCS